MEKEMEEIKELHNKNSRILDLWNEFNNDEYLRFNVNKISFRDNYLTIFIDNEVVEKIFDFRNYFKEVKNIFKDKLPEYEYFNLGDVISQYEILNYEKSKEIFKSWNDSLLNLLEYLRSKKLEITENRIGLDYILSIFNVDKPKNFKEFKKMCIKFNPLNKNFLENFSFDLNLKEKKKDNTVNILKILLENYTNETSIHFNKEVNEVDLSILNLPTNKYPDPIDIKTEGRGYKLSLKNEIQLVGVKVLLSAGADIFVNILDESANIVSSASIKTEKFIDNNWFVIPISQMLKDNFSIFVYFESKGSFHFVSKDNEIRKINDNISVYSKYIVNKSIYNNTYSIGMKLLLEKI